MMSYRTAVTYLDSFINYEKKAKFPYKQSLKLERIRDFLRSIGDPQESFSSIHVAGTKGKGSTCVFAAHILRCAGFRTALYTSPHLSDVRERIRILEPDEANSDQRDFEGMISRKALAALVSRMKPKLDAYCRSSRFGPLSFFEVYTALAFVHFKDRKVDVAVLETGLGGRLDATNVVSADICGITSISFDHMDKLGDTLKEIAQEKAGIIKGHKLIVISAPQRPSARAVLRKRCVQERALLYEVGKDIVIHSVKQGRDGQQFSLRGPEGDFDDLRIRLLGSHQLINSAVATSLVAGLARQKQLNLDVRQVRAGLCQTFWPARFEIAAKRPDIVFDAAHNVASAQALRETAGRRFKGRQVILVAGISKDKDIRGISRVLFPLADKIILTKADNPRAEEPERILQQSRGVVSAGRISVVAAVPRALEEAIKDAGAAGVVIVTGSIFMVAEARAWLGWAHRGAG